MEILAKGIWCLAEGVEGNLLQIEFRSIKESARETNLKPKMLWVVSKRSRKSHKSIWSLISQLVKSLNGKFSMNSFKTRWNRWENWKITRQKGGNYQIYPLQKEVTTITMFNADTVVENTQQKWPKDISQNAPTSWTNLEGLSHQRYKRSI